MKQRTHSGAKKTFRVKKNKVMVDKAAKRHLLVNKSKDQKSITVMEVSSTRMRATRKMLGGLKVTKKRTLSNVEKAEAAKAK